ncbi:MAG: ABC transporter ATP-binding protein [Candidatus Tectomicrobia bacterium]|nr:ABC transporter ATP-binding protein [Candidatus Tectomicrobia bacterium]
MPIIKIEKVYQRYLKTLPWAVENLNLEVESGEILTILGPSGCGKTTILRLIAGFERPDIGRIFVNGDLVAGDGVWTPPEHRGIGMVFQDYALFPHLTVEENIGFGLHRLNVEQRRERITEVLNLIDLIKYRSRYPFELSGGQQQRIALARALAPSPVVILLDEPFSNLHADLRIQMRQDIHDILRRSKTTAIFVTHDQEEAFHIANRVVVMNHGLLEQIDTPEKIYHTPLSKFVAEFVGQADFLPGIMKAGQVVTEVGTFNTPQSLPEGEEVEMMFRPDDIDIFPDEEGEGVIIARRFNGPENVYTLSLPSGQTLHSIQPSIALLRIGARVRITAIPDYVVVFPLERA